MLSPNLLPKMAHHFPDPSLYRILTGALQYVKLTRSTIVYVVQQICLFMHTPTTTHFQLIKTILRYIRGTTHFGLQLYRSSSLDLITYNDADWAGSLDTRKSMSGFYVFLGDNLMSTHVSVLVDSVGPSSAEVCRIAASFP
jgi:hypothetical protein